MAKFLNAINLFFYLPICIFAQDFFKHCDSLTIGKINIDTSFEYELIGFGKIPIDTIHYAYENNKPFTIENNCLQFCIPSMDCWMDYKLIWENEFRIDKINKTIADVKFVIKWNNPCERTTHEDCLRFNLSPLFNQFSGKDLYLNFIGYNKLIKIK